LDAATAVTPGLEPGAQAATFADNLAYPTFSLSHILISD